MGLSVMNGYRRTARHFGWNTLEDPSTIGTDSYRLFLHRRVETLRDVQRKIKLAYSSGDDIQVDDLEIWLASQSGLHSFVQDWKYWDKDTDLTTLANLGWSQRVLDSGKRSRITIERATKRATSERALTTKPTSGSRTRAKAKNDQPQDPDESKLMFVPSELEVNDRQGHQIFPENVLFVKSGVVSGKRAVGSALYEPVLSSFQKNGAIQTLTYANKYGPESLLHIKYDSQERSWKGEKHVNGEFVGFAIGTEWNRFFHQLALLGLSVGEPCAFVALAQ